MPQHLSGNAQADCNKTRTEFAMRGKYFSRSDSHKWVSILPYLLDMACAAVYMNVKTMNTRTLNSFCLDDSGDGLMQENHSALKTVVGYATFRQVHVNQLKRKFELIRFGTFLTRTTEQQSATLTFKLSWISAEYSKYCFTAKEQKLHRNKLENLKRRSLGLLCPLDNRTFRVHRMI